MNVVDRCTIFARLQVVQIDSASGWGHDRQGHPSIWLPDNALDVLVPNLVSISIPCMHGAIRSLTIGSQRRYRLFLAGILWACGVQAQPVSEPWSETGRFFVQDFAPEDYGAAAQNWNIVQDERGLIYIGNNTGILIFDGVSWRLIPTQNIVRSVVLGDDGRVFVGGDGDLGYLAPDSLGRLRFVSMLGHIAEEDRAFSDVWRIRKTTEGLYFQSYERLFLWDGRKMMVWRPQSSFYQSYVLRDTFYVLQKGIGLLRMEQDSLVMAPDGAFFQDKVLYDMVPYGASAYLAFTESHGMYQCPSQQQTEDVCRRHRPELTVRLAEAQPYQATVLPGGLVALSTLRSGLFLLDMEGRLVRILDQASGLRNQSVKYSHRDRQGGLWLALNNGLARVEVQSPVSSYDKTQGLTGMVQSLARHRGRVYAAEDQGIFQLQPARPGEGVQFAYVPGIASQCWSLLSTEQGLLAGCSRGLYNIDSQRQIWASDKGDVFSIHRSRRDSTVIYLGLERGLARVQLGEGRWHYTDTVEEVSAEVLSIVEDAEGRLWLGTNLSGVVRWQPPQAPATTPSVRRFGPTEGLPAGGWTTVALAGRVGFLSSTGLYRAVDRGTAGVSFVADTTFDAFLPQGSASIEHLTEDTEGRVWIMAGEASGVASPTAGHYRWQPTALRRAPIWGTNTMHVEADGPVWVGDGNGVFRYDPAGSFDPFTAYQVWLRRVTSADDSLLFDGEPRQSDEPPRWPYRHNALRFAFAAPRYDAPERTDYRTWLEGFDKDWSSWGEETNRYFTNLPPGSYVFHVQARDVYGVISSEDTLPFRLLPPWYRTWWAWLLYGAAASGCVLAYVRHQQRKVAHERAVNDRSRQVDKLKDEFLANTSHELRTPLYGITGLAESLIDGATGELPAETKANLAMIAGSGRRLGQLVGDILDYSRLTHKSLKLRRRPVDLRPL
ncbi:MAG: hypothetical protein GY719_14470, partial [bacterium]|nr:hypothetical protein [bacterium]